MQSRKYTVVQGFVLIEALVALIVVAVGAIGIAKLNAVMLQGSGLSKSRAEALQIAQDKVEEARNYILEDGCDDASLVADTGQITGVNAAYTFATTFPSHGTGWKAVNVCVTWDGGTCDVIGNRIILRSVMSCEGMGTTAQIGSGGANAMNAGFIRTPTGRGQVGGQTYTGTPPGTDNKITLDGLDLADGTKTNLADGKFELIDTTSGRVLLTVNKLSCETAPPAFSTIAGKIFVEAKNGAPIATDENLFALSSDASFCSKLPYNNNWVLPSGATGNNIKYFYTYYQCYVGAEWWGNIGLVRTDNANANNRVCVGNPVSANINTLFSKHAQLSSNRAYRGYRPLGNDKYETMGVGETNEVDTACTAAKGRTTYKYKANHFTNHHFVHTVISGQASNSSCQTVMTTLNNYNPTGSLVTSTSNPTVTETTTEKKVAANNNPGRFYCMSNNDGVDCANLSSNVNIPNTVVQGTITAQNGVSVTAIDPDGSSCTNTPTITPIGSNQFGFSCQIDWTGFTGSSWNGAIKFDLSTNASLCPDNVTSLVTPSTSSVAFTINNKKAAVDPNHLIFTEIPIAVTNATINFSANTACLTLGQPNVSAWTFSGTGSNQTGSFSWPAINGATGYKIRTCVTSFTCDPSASTPATQTGLTYTAPNSGTYNRCITVTATNSSGDGVTSAKRCISRSSNNKYTTS
jgi:Tfp pilus assembly protein PilV